MQVVVQPSFQQKQLTNLGHVLLRFLQLSVHEPDGAFVAPGGLNKNNATSNNNDMTISGSRDQLFLLVYI